jgi:hypothetical protein
MVSVPQQSTFGREWLLLSFTNSGFTKWAQPQGNDENQACGNLC